MIHPLKISSNIRNASFRFNSGFFSIFLGLVYIFKKRLLHYIILPSTLSILTGMLLIAIFYFFILPTYDNQSISSAQGNSGWSGYLARLFMSFPEWLVSVMEYSWMAVRLTLSIITSVLLYKLFIPVTVMPLMGPLLNRIETLELGSEIASSWQLDVINTMRSVWMGVLFSILGFSILIIGLCLGPFDIIINIVFQSYALGRGAFDIVFEKQAPRLAKRKPFIQAWKIEIFGHGLGFFVLLLIPVLGLILAPVASVAGVAILFYRSEKYKNQSGTA